LLVSVLMYVIGPVVYVVAVVVTSKLVLWCVIPIGGFVVSCGVTGVVDVVVVNMVVDGYTSGIVG